MSIVKASKTDALLSDAQGDHVMSTLKKLEEACKEADHEWRRLGGDLAHIREQLKNAEARKLAADAAHIAELTRLAGRLDE